MASTLPALEERLAVVEARLDELVSAVDRLDRPHIGITIEEARQRLSEPVERSPETIARFRRLLGSFEGPEDLSERMRDYLYGTHEEQ